MKPPRTRSTTDLLQTVERLFLHEVLTFEGEKHVRFTVEGAAPDRSVFAVASVDRTSIAVARVYEADLDHEPERALRLVYMLRADLEQIQAVIHLATTGGASHG